MRDLRKARRLTSCVQNASHYLASRRFGHLAYYTTNYSSHLWWCSYSLLGKAPWRSWYATKELKSFRKLLVFMVAGSTHLCPPSLFTTGNGFFPWGFASLEGVRSNGGGLGYAEMQKWRNKENRTKTRELGGKKGNYTINWQITLFIFHSIFLLISVK